MVDEKVRNLQRQRNTLMNMQLDALIAPRYSLRSRSWLDRTLYVIILAGLGSTILMLAYTVVQACR